MVRKSRLCQKLGKHNLRAVSLSISEVINGKAIQKGRIELMNETEQINRKIPVVMQKQGISRAINEKGRGRNAIFQDLTLIIF